MAMEVLEVVLQAVTVMNILSGIPGSLKMWRTGKTEGWPILFFIIGFCGALGMFIYGLLQDNSTLYMLNGLNATVSVYYILAYVILAGMQTEPVLYITAAALYLAGLYSGYHSYENGQMDQKLNLIGFSSSIIFFLMNCATILDVISAVSSKSVTFDVAMLMFGMLSNMLWITYGVMLNDIYIYGPALPFVLTGTMKLMLISIYSTKDKSKDD